MFELKAGLFIAVVIKLQKFFGQNIYYRKLPTGILQYPTSKLQWECDSYKVYNYIQTDMVKWQFHLYTGLTIWVTISQIFKVFKGSFLSKKEYWCSKCLNY
jgi:hypothetical protein